MNQPTVVKVTELPVPNITSPIPTFSEGQINVPMMTDWENMETEACVAIIMHECAKAGKWVAIPWDKFIKTMTDANFSHLAIGIARALYDLDRSQEIQLLECEGTTYVVPSQTLISKASKTDIWVQFALSNKA